MPETTTYRTEFGVRMACHKKASWTEIVALGSYTDAASIFDHTAFSEARQRDELRNALRRHARWVARRPEL